MKRGEIYYIKSNYSETGFEQKGDRPAVIVSNDKCNEHSCVLEVVFMTTKPKKPLPTHVLVKEDSARPSTVLCEQITSVDIGRISDYMGTLTEEEMLEVDKALAISLGLPLPDDERELAATGALATFEDDPTDEDEEEEGKSIVSELYDTCSELETDLAKALTELEVYKKLYSELLNRLAR